jgi:hypothetical protein
MASRVEAAAPKEQSLRVVAFQISLGLFAHASDRETVYRMACDVGRQRFLEATGCKG